MKKSVVIICPNPESFITTSLCELLLRENIIIDAVIVKKFTVHRFIEEFSRDGKRLIKKIWRKLILRSNAYDRSNTENIISFRQEFKITLRNVKELVKLGTDVLYVDDVNSNEVENLLTRTQPDLVVFTGGGVDKREYFKSFWQWSY
ncbi:hypothetical protein OAI64_02520 [Schleiferiaceae bacterium]|nr:hypothetical protein [Schleiferiaceae bacterium]